MQPYPIREQKCLTMHVIGGGVTDIGEMKYVPSTL